MGMTRRNSEIPRRAHPAIRLAVPICMAVAATDRSEFIMENLAPRHIQKDESDRLGIKHGWYGIKINGTLMTGPSSTEQECLNTIEKMAAAAGKGARPV